MAKRPTTAERERLSRDTIVGGAVALADREGLDAVTIRRLAQDHGVTPMALYWHFREKDEVLAGMVEYLFDQVELPDETDQPWHVQLSAVLDASLAAIRQHPAIAELTVSRILSSGSGLLVAERVLALLRSGGFSTEQAGEVGRYLVGAIITLVTVEPGAEHGDSGDKVRAKKATLNALSPRRYPNIVESADVLTSCQNPDAYFSRGVDLLVQGARGIAPK